MSSILLLFSPSKATRNHQTEETKQAGLSNLPDLQPASSASPPPPPSAATMATPDLLFNLRNLFYLGAYQAAINNSDVPGLDADAAAERDAIVFRSYIALGSYQVRADR